jgi:hypothetical protein
MANEGSRKDMSYRVEERDGRLIAVRVKPGSIAPRNTAKQLSAIKRLGLGLFRTFSSAKLTEDGFALIGLGDVRVNGEPYTTDLRLRFASPDQQARLGLCALPWIGIPVIIFASLILGIGGSVDSLGEYLFVAAFLANFVGCFAATWFAFDTTGSINAQIFDGYEEEA